MSAAVAGSADKGSDGGSPGVGEERMKSSGILVPPGSDTSTAFTEDPTEEANTNTPAADQHASAESSERRQEPQAGGGGGGLYLTCLRLRYEEVGSWSKVFEEKPMQRSPAAVDATASEIPAPELVPEAEAAEEVSPKSPVRLTWKEWSGRDHGDEKYRIGDIARGTTKRMSELAKKMARRGSKTTSELQWNGPIFGMCGPSIEYHRSDASGLEGVVASHVHGAQDGGITITASPLPERIHGSAGAAEERVTLRQYFFEFSVLEVDPCTTRTLMLGFVWQPHCTSGSEQATALPATASELSQAFVIGGDPPRWFLAGRDLGKLAGWRPLIHTVAGSVFGALLEVSSESGKDAAPPSLRFILFQDQKRCAEHVVELIRPEDAWVLLPGPGPHGLIDICGNVRKVQLSDAAHPSTGNQA